MKLVTVLWVASVAAAGGALALAYAWAGLWELGLIWAGLALAWGWLQEQRRWVQHAGLVLCCMAAALGFTLPAPPLALLGAVCAALCAWDLGHFRGRLAAAAQAESSLVWRHLGLLFSVALLGFLTGASTLQTQVNLSFPAAVALVLALFYSLGRLFFRTRPER